MLLSNPLVSPFWPTLETVFLSLFGGSLVAMLVVVRDRSVLLARWRTWLLIATVFSLATLSGPVPLALVAAAIALQGSREYSHLVHLPTSDRRVLYVASVALPLSSVALEVHYLALVMLSATLVATIPALLEQDIDNGMHRVARLAFGLWYLPLTLSLMVLMERLGPGLLLAVALSVALSDVGAFAIGKLFGRRSLAPRLSPAKTWAGFVGNAGGAALGLWLLHPLAPAAPYLLLAPIIGMGALWGDLLESLLKRGAGAKDAGNWLPGFGGLLDRVDSLLVVLPLAYVAVMVSA